MGLFADTMIKFGRVWSFDADSEHEKGPSDSFQTHFGKDGHAAHVFYEKIADKGFEVGLCAHAGKYCVSATRAELKRMPSVAFVGGQEEEPVATELADARSGENIVPLQISATGAELKGTGLANPTVREVRGAAVGGGS
jgi:hypothetical protein